LDDIDTQGRFALVLGSEASGLSDATREACDVLTTLPMQGGCDSLNVAMAAGIFFHQLRNV
jgi:tRNA G18 (ribose-2'-O)-methylase SpoU